MKDKLFINLNTKEQQTKDKIERWLAQVRNERLEYLSSAQVRMQKNIQRQRSNNERAVRALQAVEQARKSAQLEQTQTCPQRVRSSAGERLFIFPFMDFG